LTIALLLATPHHLRLEGWSAGIQTGARGIDAAENDIEIALIANLDSASMRPLHRCRGKPNGTNAPMSTFSFFNEAAASMPRKTACTQVALPSTEYAVFTSARPDARILRLARRTYRFTISNNQLTDKRFLIRERCPIFDRYASARAGFGRTALH
jgi:hypothetical protein